MEEEILTITGARTVGVSVEGAWTDYFGQARFLGRLDADEPVAVLSAVFEDDGSICYAKSPRRGTSNLDVDLLLHPNADASRYQMILYIGGSINTEAILSAGRRVSVPPVRRFQTGSLVDWAEPDAVGPTLRLLVLAESDLRNARTKIWGLSRALTGGLTEPWLTPLTRTRHGRIAASGISAMVSPVAEG